MGSHSKYRHYYGVTFFAHSFSGALVRSGYDDKRDRLEIFI